MNLRLITGQFLIIDLPISNNLKALSPCITLIHNIIDFFAGPTYQKYVENFIMGTLLLFKNGLSLRMWFQPYIDQAGPTSGNAQHLKG